MKPAGIFERVQFLESRLDRLEVVLLEQDRVIRGQAKKLGTDYKSLLLEPSTRKMADIAAEIASDNGLTIQEIRSRSMERAVAWPRQYAYASLLDAGFSAASIGRFFDRDHSTVLAGAEKARSRQHSVDMAVNNARTCEHLLQSGDKDD